jgi:hypothetical protein
MGLLIHGINLLMIGGNSSFSEMPQKKALILINPTWNLLNGRKKYYSRERQSSMELMLSLRRWREKGINSI